MALSSSVSQALDINKEAPSAPAEIRKLRRSHHAATLGSMRVALKLETLAWTCHGATGAKLPNAGKQRMVERDAKQNEVGFRAEYGPCDAIRNLPGNLQQQATLQQLRSARVIACLRASSSNMALDSARSALDGGLTALEVTMNTPLAAQVIKVLVREYPSAIIGAGTVLSPREADMAKDAGAQFLMSPVTVEEMVCDHRNGPVLYIPGAMTPTEVINAYNLGASAVKLYPVSLLGGVRFVQTLSKPLGHVPMIASNGISLDMVKAYISAGAVAVILSEAIFEKAALENNDMSRIRILAGAALCRATSLQSELVQT